MPWKRRFNFARKFMAGNLARYLGSMLSVAITVAVGFITPLLLRETIDSIIGNEPMQAPVFIQNIINFFGGTSVLAQNLWICGLALVLLSFINGLFLFTKGKWAAEASEGIAKSIRDSLYTHLQRLPYQYHVKAETGDLIQRCSSDVETVRRFLSMQLVEMFRAVLMLGLSIAILLPQNRNLTLLSIIMIPFVLVFSMVFFKLIVKNFKKTDEAEGRMSAVIQENLTGVRVVRAFGRQKYEVDKFEEVSENYRRLGEKQIFLFAIYWPVSDLMCMAQIAITLVSCILMAIRGEITVGTMLVFTSYVGMLLWPVRQLGRILSDLGKSVVSIDRIDEILRESSEADAPDAIEPSLEADIVFDDVSFAYDDNHPILQNVSFTVKQGQTVAILGATGSGKSTLVHLLQRLYDCKSGRIFIGGVDITKIKKDWLRRHVGIVLQEPFLYSKTIRQNIGIAKEGLSDDEIFGVAKVARADGFITEFEKGYDTEVGERGVTLSGGQKQRLAIARTLIKDNDILIFDDSLSAVDTETDASIRAALRTHRKNITTFIISHRITTLSEADFIIVFEKGRIVQQGTHDELVSQTGLYQRIYNIQSMIADDIEDSYEAQSAI